jgi:hypothetical protein
MKKSAEIKIFMPEWKFYFIFAGKNTEVKSVKKRGSDKRVKGKRKNT